MIFWFSGTGNSLYAAKKLSGLLTGERLIDMAQAINSGLSDYTVGDNECIGFVFPTYYATLPETVRRFIASLALKNADGKYIWAVVTCGSEMMTVPMYLSAALRERNMIISAVFELKMPDNYVMAYNPASKHTAAGVMKDADARIPVIAEKIRSKLPTATVPDIPERAIGTVLSPFYDKLRNTRKFYVNDRCTGCGMCEEICPEKAIELKDGKPVWIKEKCAHCAGCISRCPAYAIEYGNATQRRRRYVNPSF